jgi:hypothetical protein
MILPALSVIGQPHSDLKVKPATLTSALLNDIAHDIILF